MLAVAKCVSHKAARVTVGGSAHTTRAPRCSQLQSFWTVDIAGRPGNVEAVVLLRGNRAIPKWVKISDFDGFADSFWQGGVGDAAAHLAHNTLTVTGIAYGINSAHPNKVITTDFKITADC
ncbi:lipoprotein LpqH [Mycobacterium noviomagense]|nr:hypothetical protein BST37_08480 [Mycobacterium noviomagense]